MDFVTPYNYSPPAPEMFEGERGEKLVETEGYVSAQVQIENMIYAGQRLESSRRGYDFDSDEIDEDYYDPTRAQNFDMADATQLKLQADSAVKAYREALKASQTASQAPGAVSPAQPVQTPPA